MGRRSGGGGRSRSGGGLFGGRSKTRSAAARAPARKASTRAAPPPAKAPGAAPPAAAPAGGGGGMLSGLGGMIAQGMMFGTGSAIAHRAVDAVAGPRQVEHVHSGGEGQVRIVRDCLLSEQKSKGVCV